MTLAEKIEVATLMTTAAQIADHVNEFVHNGLMKIEPSAINPKGLQQQIDAFADEMWSSLYGLKRAAESVARTVRPAASVDPETVDLGETPVVEEPTIATHIEVAADRDALLVGVTL